MNLQNARILITGGSMGIGKVTAKELVMCGGKVIITGRDWNRLEKSAAEVGAIPVLADVTNEKDRAHTFAEAASKLGGLDVLINNAGIGEFSTVLDLQWHEFEKIFATNVFAVAMMTKLAVEIFSKQNYGHIVNVASTAAQKGFAGGTVYAASKFALRGMTQCWQAELRKHNIRVMEVNPSEVTTAFGTPDRKERQPQANRLRGEEVAHAIKTMLEMDNRGFIPEMTIWATNPWK